MKRGVLVLCMMLLVINVATEVCLASINMMYNTSTRQKIGALTNDSATTQTAYCRLIPISGSALLQICNATGSIIYESQIYPVYPQNQSYTTVGCSSGATISFFVKPVVAGEYIWGYAEIGFW